MSAENSDCESVVPQAPSRQPTSTCSPSTSGISTPTSCGSRRRSGKMRRKMSRTRCLLAIEHRNRLRKLAAQKVRIASNWLSPASLLRWEKRFGREYEKEFEETKVALERLRQERDVLLANRRLILKGCSALKDCAMLLQMKLQQEMHESLSGFSSPDDFFSPYS